MRARQEHAQDCITRVTILQLSWDVMVKNAPDNPAEIPGKRERSRKEKRIIANFFRIVKFR